ncbi:MAG: ABC transporter ATP-binding protein [Mycoplasma sp.]
MSKKNTIETSTKLPKGQFFNIFKKLITFSKKHFWMIIFVALLGVGSATITIYAPKLLEKIIDEMQKWIFGLPPSIDPILNWSITLIILYLFTWLMNYINRYIMAIYSQRVSKKMRTDLNKKIDNLPMSHFNDNSTGGTLSVIANDADAIGVSLNNSIGTLILQVTLLFGSLIMMFVSNWVLALTVIGSTLFGFILTVIIMGKSQVYFNDQRKWLSKINGHIEECFSGQTVIKVYNGEKEVTKIFNDLNIGLSTKTFKSQALSSLMMPIMFFVDKFAYVMVYVVGAVLVSTNQFSTTYATIVLFVFYARYFTQPLSQIAQAMQSLQTGIAASSRVFDFLELNEMKVEENSTIKINLKDFKALTKLKQFLAKALKDDHRLKCEYDNEELKIISTDKTELISLIKKLNTEFMLAIDSSQIQQIPRESKTINHSEIKGKVEFKNVKFGYDKDKIIIKNFSAIAKPSQKVAIVGPTGAGKTTIVNLLMRYFELNSGDILIDDVSIHDMKQSTVRDMFCMVLQDTWLFDGTIKENIVYSKKGVSDEQVLQAVESVGLTHYIKTLPDGLNTVLSSKISLSEGQKQQITIARAMIQNSPMLILDEATSNVDTRTEIHIQNAMDQLMSNRTSFVIAHRLSTIKNADLILVLKDGDIIEKGNHDELLSKKGFYEKLYNSQFQNK